MLYIFGGISAPSDIPDFKCSLEFPYIEADILQILILQQLSKIFWSLEVLQ